MAYDDRRGITWLYGDRASDADVIWGWNGSRWTPYRTTGPGLRRHIKLAYDRKRDRVVLYGGYDNAGRAQMSDTWEWDGGAWRRATDEGPGPRSSYSLVFDPSRKKVVLFGGLSSEGAMSDAWEWDGRHWILIDTKGPEPRGEAGAAYDPFSKALVVAGGMAYERVTLRGGATSWALQRQAMPRDTWALRGRTWRRLSVGEVPRMGTMVADPISGALLRIAGESDTGYQGDMWRWSGREWTPVPGADITPRHGAAMALDTRRHRIVLFGGSGPGGKPLRDLWEWDGVGWHSIGMPAALQ